MKRSHISLLFCLYACVGIFVSSLVFSEDAAPDPDKLRKMWVSSNPVNVFTGSVSRSEAIVDVGRMLFFDARVSVSGKRSCNSCHVLSDYGANGGIDDLEGERDVPTLYDLNALLYYSWDGRYRNLSDQIRASLTSPHELGEQSMEDLVARLGKIEGYAKPFETAFPESGLTTNTVVHAMVAFQEGLTTVSPWDRFLGGDNKALDARALAGAEQFDTHSCSSCHTGGSLGGQMIQKLGLIRPWPNQADKGYSAVSGDAAHDMFFRVAPLRNIDKTRPYFHDRSARSLRRAVHYMARFERGHDLNFEAMTQIEAFLKSLSGELPKAYIKAPTLPK